MRNFAIVFTLLASALAAGSAGIDQLADGVIRPSAIPGMRESYLPIVFPSSHAANLIVLPNGDILCDYYSGLWENASDLGIVVARLAKGSNRWSKPVTADHKPGYAFQNPVLFQPPQGPLWLLHTSQKENAGEAEAEVYLLKSDDAGKTWGAPKILFTGGYYDRNPVVAAGNRWLLPMYRTPDRGATKNSLNDYASIQISDDRGKTWKSCDVPESKGLAQPNIVETAPGRFLAFFRSRYADWIYSSTSTDGCTWTSPKPTQLPNNNASTQMVRLRNGHLAIAFNNTQKSPQRGTKKGNAPRVPLTVALSVDNGATWPWVRDIDRGNPRAENPVPEKILGVAIPPEAKKKFDDHLDTYEYPAIVQDQDGAIHVAYSFHRRTMKHVIFAEDWIQRGDTVGVFKGDKK
jgi:predicted neuraminidase